MKCPVRPPDARRPRVVVKTGTAVKLTRNRVTRTTGLGRRDHARFTARPSYACASNPAASPRASSQAQPRGASAGQSPEVNRPTWVGGGLTKRLTHPFRRTYAEGNKKKHTQGETKAAPLIYAFTKHKTRGEQNKERSALDSTGSQKPLCCYWCYAHARREHPKLSRAINGSVPCALRTKNQKPHRARQTLGHN